MEKRERLWQLRLAPVLLMQAELEDQLMVLQQELQLRSQALTDLAHQLEKPTLLLLQELKELQLETLQSLQPPAEEQVALSLGLPTPPSTSRSSVS